MYIFLGLQAITSLLLGTTLRPHMGDPTSSVPMSVHRNNEMLFLGSRCAEFFFAVCNDEIPFCLFLDQAESWLIFVRDWNWKLF